MASIKQVLDAQVEAAKADKPKATLRPRGPRHDIGDGDPCPFDEGKEKDQQHGKMLTIPGSYPAKQYCPHQSHDGKAGEGQTRAIWPLGDNALAAAVAQTIRHEDS